MSRISTVYLLTCAAIGVAGGVVLWATTGLSAILTVTVPWLQVAFTGFWMLPGVIALRLLQRPLAGILTGLIAGLVILPYLGSSLWWVFFAELPFLLLLYRRWWTWLHYLGALLAAVPYPILAAEYFDVWAMPLWTQIAMFAVTIASCVVVTGLGILIADRLRAAGVARLARRGGASVRPPRVAAPQENSA